MFIKCNRLMTGPGPSEVIVEIETVDGKEELIVDSDFLENGCLQVWLVAKKDSDKVLVELPREAVSGRARAWIKSGDEMSKDACLHPAE